MSDKDSIDRIFHYLQELLLEVRGDPYVKCSARPNLRGILVNRCGMTEEEAEAYIDKLLEVPTGEDVPEAIRVLAQQRKETR